MKLTDHLRLIWPNRQFIAVGDDITFFDGKPMPTKAQLDATRAQAEALFAAEQAPPPEPPPAPPPPITVTMASLRISLGRDICVAIGAWIGQIVDVDAKFQAQTWWEKAPYVRRDHPVVEQFRLAMNKTTSEVDSWFTNAAQLDKM
jgi:hypothetical protein